MIEQNIRHADNKILWNIFNEIINIDLIEYIFIHNINYMLIFHYSQKNDIIEPVRYLFDICVIRNLTEHKVIERLVVVSLVSHML